MGNAAKYRLEPNRAQRDLIGRTFGCCRYVHNAFLALRRDAWNDRGVSLTYGDTSEILGAMKRQEHTKWLTEVDSTALQSELKRLDSAFQNFFAKRSGYPNFRRKHDHRQSYTTKCVYNYKRQPKKNGKGTELLPDANGERIPAGLPSVEVRHGAVKLPKLGWVKARTPRLPGGRILNATVTQEPDSRYYVSVCFEEPDPAIPDVCTIANAAGVDMGIKDIAVTSDGIKYENHQHLRSTEHQLKCAQRSLSRKRKGSKNWEKQRIRAARLHGRVRNQRQDTLHKTSHEIVSTHDAVFTEDLNVRGMLQNRCLAKSVADASFGELCRMLQYKCERQGKVFAKVDRFYPSSQLCSSCGEKNPAVKNLAVREWSCPKCGARHDRDINAAVNICNEGLRTLRSQ